MSLPAGDTDVSRFFLTMTTSSKWTSSSCKTCSYRRYPQGKIKSQRRFAFFFFMKHKTCESNNFRWAPRSFSSEHFDFGRQHCPCSFQHQHAHFGCQAVGHARAQWYAECAETIIATRRTPFPIVLAMRSRGDARMTITKQTTSKHLFRRQPQDRL